MPDYTLPLNELPDPLSIEPLREPFDVTITPPGSKSITNRAYVLAALADGTSRIIRPLRSDDCDRLLNALCTLGAEAQWDGDDVLITGVNGRFPRGGEVNLGDGGTPTRFMIACACLAAAPVTVDGSARMRERPVAEGVDMLRQLGAQIEYVEEEGRLPVRVTPSEQFSGGTLEVGKTASSQFISAVMLIAPWLADGVELSFTERLTSLLYIMMTGNVLFTWEYASEVVSGDMFKPPCRMVFPTQPVRARDYSISTDQSSSIYWKAAEKLVYGSSIPDAWEHDSHCFQPDEIAVGRLWDLLNHRRETVLGSVSRLLGIPRPYRTFTADMEAAPDGAMMVITVAATVPHQSTFTGLHTLRVKETDRIEALANELTKVGCEVTTTDDSITIIPIPRDEQGTFTRSEPVEIETYNDHRMAMAFAVLGLVREGISIRNPACVRKSYPTFWQDFAKLYQ